MKSDLGVQFFSLQFTYLLIEKYVKYRVYHRSGLGKKYRKNMVIAWNGDTTHYQKTIGGIWKPT